MNGPETVNYLDRLLTWMDGLRDGADGQFILITTRPQKNEGAPASRPGRVDKAIMFGNPDAPCHCPLVILWGQVLASKEGRLQALVARSEGRQRGVHQGYTVQCLA